MDTNDSETVIAQRFHRHPEFLFFHRRRHYLVIWTSSCMLIAYLLAWVWVVIKICFGRVDRYWRLLGSMAS